MLTSVISNVPGGIHLIVLKVTIFSAKFWYISAITMDMATIDDFRVINVFLMEFR